MPLNMALEPEAFFMFNPWHIAFLPECTEFSFIIVLTILIRTEYKYTEFLIRMAKFNETLVSYQNRGF